MAEKPVRRELPLRKKLLFMMAVFLPVLLALELSMRIWGDGPAKPVGPAGPQEAPKEPPPLSAFQYYSICDENLGFRNRRNGSFRSPHIDGTPLSTTDRFGFRNGYGWAAEGDSPIVLFLGDSITFAAEYGKWNAWARRHGGEEVLQRLVVEMDGICRDHGAAFLTTSYADGTEIEAAERFAEICAEVDVRFVDLKHAFQGPWRSYFALRTDGTYDPHYGPEGTKAYAAALAPALNEVLRSRGIASKQARSQ